MGFGDILVIFFLLIALTVSSYYFYDTYMNQSTLSSEFSLNESEGRLSQGVQFYPNMRYPEKRIAYSLDINCNAEKKGDVLEAFYVISSETNLEFYESSSEKGITILCSNVSPKPEQKNYFIAGEGGPTEIVNASKYYIIFASQVSLYRSEKCDNPIVAIHEILHALGFDHTNEKNSIMYPVSDCSQKIDESIKEEINKIYSVPSIPDLAIVELNANKTGRLLNFEISIDNYGLASSDNVSLKVYSSEGSMATSPKHALEAGPGGQLSRYADPESAPPKSER